MKGRKYTKKQIGRALAAYEVAGESPTLASRIVGIPESTIRNWLKDEEVQKDKEIAKYSVVEKSEVQQESYNLAKMLLPRIAEKAYEEEATLHAIVGAYAQLMEKGGKIEIHNQNTAKSESGSGLQILVHEARKEKGENGRMDHAQPTNGRMGGNGKVQGSNGRT